MSYLIQRGKNQKVQNVSRLKLYKQRGTRRIREREVSTKGSVEQYMDMEAAQEEDTSDSSDEEMVEYTNP